MKTPSVEGEITNSASRVGDGVVGSVLDGLTPCASRLSTSRVARARHERGHGLRLADRPDNELERLVARHERPVAQRLERGDLTRGGRALVFASHASSESAVDAAAGARYGTGGGGVITARRGAGPRRLRRRRRGYWPVRRSTHPM